MSFYDAIRVGASGAADFEIERSLRFNNYSSSADDAALTRTVSSTGNRKTFTHSFWVKRTKLGYGMIYGHTDTAGSYFFSFVFNSDNKIEFNEYRYNESPSNKCRLITTRVFRDPSAWYHIVAAVDTTQSTASDRIKIYVNGVQETRFGTAIYFDQNHDTYFNSTSPYPIMRIGLNGWGYGGANCYLTEFNAIDGLQLTPSSFAETNAVTGQWIAKKYVGSYGTNGFRLNFSDNSGTTATTLGKDSSGNGNNFTPNNFAVSDSITDTPSKNFCTLNPLNATNDVDLREGNLEFFQSSNDESATATFGITSGKWYWEVYKNSSQNPELGIEVPTRGLSNKTDDVSPTKVCIRTNGGDQQVGTGSPTSITGSSGGLTGAGVLAIAVDFDNKKIWYSDLSGNFFNSGNPATGANAAFTFSSVAVADECVPYFFCGTGGNNSFNINFGQDGTFAGHTTAGGYVDGNGHGNFKYSVPSGYLALCSANLPDPTILLPNKHFDTKLFTGNGSSQTISSLNFAPDWVWLKCRNSSSSRSHILTDRVRGATKSLLLPETDAESTQAQDLTAFTSDGFSVGSNRRVNENSKNLVAWNWNAGDTDGKTYTVTVVDDSGNKYRFDGYGTSAVTLDLAEGGTYIFNYPSAHPFRFSTTSDGTHGGGSEYTTGVTVLSSTSIQIVVAASAPQLYYYCSIHSGMGGAINTNSTLGSSNFDGSIQSTVKVNATAGFSIATWTSDGSGSPTSFGHGLGVKPDLLIIKSRGGSGNWQVWSSTFSNATNNFISLNLTDGTQTAGAAMWGTINSTIVSFRHSANSSNGQAMIGYFFSGVESYSKFGSYTGNGNANGTFVFTGFRPAWVMIKRTSGTQHWRIFDNKRNTFNDVDLNIIETYGAEFESSAYNALDFLSNGFKLVGTNADEGTNQNGQSYIYLAFGESPFKNSRAR